MRLALIWDGGFSSIVSIHASVKDATLIFRDNRINNGFNPRICKRCDAWTVVGKTNEDVSIHASVKDATFVIFPASSSAGVSIHASVKDATPCL